MYAISSQKHINDIVDRARRERARYVAGLVGRLFHLRRG
ncbi:hypothetical protein roselon_01476 [Roseibacterium elongatum DSM 19469]|uniref:Uncharacterized protein n=1 Tax=Roseicyclus elongatus DSM 19469 TaxID=1294273 RepID=W8RRQ4_9RHOB|nr:hypothetical protein roselon_01476 [Roseibacterium elongatum DSM 19469]